MREPPWERIAVPGRVFEVETMLSEAERRLLYWLGAEYATGAGAIVDAGSFVGGSTVALAEGLRANDAARGVRIDVFDRFEVDEFMAERYLPGLRAGESFRPVFDANNARVRDLLTVHEGDLEQVAWDARPVEVLFVDIAKTWELNDTVNRRFFPWLIPGRSIVVQQDMAHAFCPWLAITMEHFADAFELLGYVEQNSVVYRCHAPITAIPAALRSLPDDRKLALLDRAVARFDGKPAALLRCAKVALLAELGDREAARAELDAIRAAGGDDPAVAYELGELEAAGL